MYFVILMVMSSIPQISTTIELFIVPTEPKCS